MSNQERRKTGSTAETKQKRKTVLSRARTAVLEDTPVSLLPSHVPGFKPSGDRTKDAMQRAKDIADGTGRSFRAVQKIERDAQLSLRAALKIQSCWRGFKARRRLLAKREPMSNVQMLHMVRALADDATKYERASAVIKRYARGWLGRRRAKIMQSSQRAIASAAGGMDPSWERRPAAADPMLRQDNLKGKFLQDVIEEIYQLCNFHTSPFTEETIKLVYTEVIKTQLPRKQLFQLKRDGTFKAHGQMWSNAKLQSLADQAWDEMTRNKENAPMGFEDFHMCIVSFVEEWCAHPRVPPPRPFNTTSTPHRHHLRAASTPPPRRFNTASAPPQHRVRAVSTRFPKSSDARHGVDDAGKGRFSGILFIVELRGCPRRPTSVSVIRRGPHLQRQERWGREGWLSKPADSGSLGSC
ncbi:hypothetical protein CYMTET_8637 [Cymbomonas tetramitiformis]|uniref:Uncharacterized protein n=1 Tax=Cymbomonas tetramitiformis TaxID=36881 RepID=A0AAE0GT53_9CHLO|nr:hypothetical protein CYMTET_8637 [Cymbomonas tetramitiformis]